MNPIIIHHRSVHHASNSGYSRLIDCIPDARIVNGEIKFPYRIAKFISENTNQLAGSYISSSVLKEIELFKELSKNEKQIVHYLNAERDIRYLINYRKFLKNTSFCGTFHKPPSILKEQIIATKYLRQLDGVVAVGINQVAFLKEWLNMENVTYIPHGVDTDFFKFDRAKRIPNRILFVGQHLRDFDIFNFCVKKLLELNKNIEVIVVIREEYNKIINYKSNISILNNISDNELRLEYQKASILFLPLIDATACNSILEAMSCGLPIVTSDVGGVSEYLKGSENIFIPKSDSDDFIEIISDLLKDDVKLNTMGKSSRKKAMEYDWKIVSEKVVAFYNTLGK